MLSRVELSSLEKTALAIVGSIKPKRTEVQQSKRKGCQLFLGILSENIYTSTDYINPLETQVLENRLFQNETLRTDVEGAKKSLVWPSRSQVGKNDR